MLAHLFLPLLLAASSLADPVAQAQQDPPSAAVSAETVSYPLYHRLIRGVDGREPSPFEARGEVVLPVRRGAGSVSFHSDKDAVAALAQTQREAGDVAHDWYQVGLEVGGQMLTGSIKASLTVYTSGSANSPSGIEFKATDAPANGVCPDVKGSGVGELEVVSLGPELSFGPSLAPPPTPRPLDATGKPVEPEPEKTFLQKYWVYISIGFLLLLMGGGEDPNKQRAAPAK